MRNQAFHRSILAVDIEGFSRAERDDDIRSWLRRHLNESLERALASVGLSPDRVIQQDTGDGTICLIDTDQTSLVVDAVEALTRGLRRYNRKASDLASLRLRVVVHDGDVVLDDSGMSGDAVNLACRLLDSELLRGRLRADPGDLVLMVSDPLYREVIAQCHCDSYERSHFERVQVEHKGSRVQAWALRPPDERLRATVGEAPMAGVGVTAPDRAVNPPPAPPAWPWKALAGRVPVGRRWSIAAWKLVVLLLVVSGLGATVVVIWPEGCAKNPVEVPLLSSQAMEGILGPLANDLINPPGAACRRANVHVYSAPSDAAVTAIAAGWSDKYLREVGPEPAAWIPDSSIEVEQVRRRANSPKLTALGSVAQSPVILAMAGRDREAAGLDQTAPWSTILNMEQLPNDPNVLLTRANPTSSTAALLGTVAMYATGSETNPNARGHDVEQVIEPSGDTEAAELCVLGPTASDDRKPPRAIIASEQSMVSRNREELGQCGSAGRGNAPGLEAIYPSNGTYMLDYPYVVLPAASEYRDRARIVEDLFHRLRSPEAQRRLRDGGFRDLDGRIEEKDGVLPNQPQNRLPLPDGQAVQGYIDQWRTVRRPVTTLLAMDISGSMNTTFTGRDDIRMTVAREGARHIVQRIGSRDRLGLWKFSTLVDGHNDYKEVLQPRPADEMVDGLSRRDQVLAQIDAMKAKPTGDTGLYDTMIAGMKRLRQVDSEADALNALIVVTDGQNDDPGGGASLDDVVQQHSDGDPVYVAVLTFGTAACDNDEFKRLAGRSGVQCIDAGEIGMDRASEQISATLWGTRESR
jgi:Ca-activated chloride channel family protein